MRSRFRSIHASLSRVALVLGVALAVPLIAATSAHYFTPNSQWSTAAQNARLSAINTQATSGFIDIYTGTQPATANSTITGTLLCSLPLGSTAFKAPSSGTMVNNGAISCTASATGTAGYVIMYKSAHTSADVLWMGSVGTSSANLVLATTAISSGITVNLADAALTISDLGSISGY